MKGQWALLSVAAIAAGVGVGIYSTRHRQAPAAAPPPSSAVVLPQQVTLTSKVRAVHIVSVRPEITGNLDQFLADVGDEVYQGQELASIGTTGLEAARADAAAAVEKAQNDVENAEKTVTAAQLEASRAHADELRARTDMERASKTYERQKVLFTAGATPRLTYEKAGNDYESALQQWQAVDKVAREADQRILDTRKVVDNAKQILADKSAQLDAASADVDAGTVQSPVDGLIVARNGAVGESAQPASGGLFEIATDLWDLEVPIEPKPELLRQMHPGQQALVIIPDLPDTAVTGQVKEIKDGKAVVGFQSSIPAIRPGMVAEVRLRPAQ